jgi:hypothetical protein
LLLRYDPALIARRDGPFDRAFFVDLGYGFEPVTTVASFSALRRLNPALPVLGVEIDPARVAVAQPYARPGLAFRLGGFNLPLGTWPDGAAETVRVVRAFNVLRQYPPDEVAAAYAHLAQGVLPGGLLVEGTSDPAGSVWVAHLLRRRDGAGDEPWQCEALVFSTNFRDGFDPAHFQPVLPKNLIQRVVPGEPIHTFLAAWKRAAAETSALRVWGPRGWFVAAARRLRATGHRVDPRNAWLRKGYLIWRDPDLGPMQL